jgi:hypothetical protein
LKTFNSVAELENYDPLLHKWVVVVEMGDGSIEVHKCDLVFDEVPVGNGTTEYYVSLYTRLDNHTLSTPSFEFVWCEETHDEIVVDRVGCCKRVLAWQCLERDAILERREFLRAVFRGNIALAEYYERGVEALPLP